MENYLTHNPTLIIFVLLSLLEAVKGRFWAPHSDSNETVIDVLSFALSFVIFPTIFFLVSSVVDLTAPQLRGSISHWPWLVVLGLYLVGEDMLQYWWHRLGHTRLTWIWHRAHHSAPYMGVRMTYRNGLLYTFFMPNLWVSALLLILGSGWVALAYGVTKGLVVVAAHSELRWDAPLYKYRFLHPLAWIVERTISTPATHFAHHALNDADGAGHPNGNFGNLLFFWDVLFGTARITRRYPSAFGVATDISHGREHWTVQLFYPLFGSRRPQSEFRQALLRVSTEKA